jgi:anti-sigma regulatory factor (Ser/Thr protein kinase)
MLDVALPGFEHEALVYAGTEEFLAGTVPFITAGLDNAEPVLVALPRERVELLRSALGARADEVAFLAMEDIGRNPATIIPAWRTFIDERPADGRPIRGIGEPIWAARSLAELDECHLHESLLNEAFSATPAFTLLCPYDTTTLDPATVEEARRTHPFVLQHGSRAVSSLYAAVDVRERRFRAALPEPTSRVIELPIVGAQLSRDLSGFRARVAEHGIACELTPFRVEDLVLVVDELIVNAVRHGGGDGYLRMWQDGDAAICEVHDNGALHNAMAGRVNPGHVGTGGRGLWIVNQICDLVQIRSTPQGTVVRVQISNDLAA